MSQPVVSIIMGSQSDWPLMQKTCKTFDDFGVSYEVHIYSAHRTPYEAAEYASSAQGRGIKVIIAAAGMAAHLAGVVAGHTILPVIGVPVKGGIIDGLDALLATVQMPSGVPVATVAVNGAVNAAMLAIQILATSDETLTQALVAYKQKMTDTVLAADAAVQQELKGE